MSSIAMFVSGVELEPVPLLGRRRLALAVDGANHRTNVDVASAPIPPNLERAA